MGQKVHPIGIRLGIVKEHNSLWYAGPKTYSDCLVTDLQVREYLFKRLKNASVSRVKIERPSENVRITISTARPGIVIGKKGEDVERLASGLHVSAHGLPLTVSARVRCPRHQSDDAVRPRPGHARHVSAVARLALDQRRLDVVGDVSLPKAFY